jgi:hypothetical protein
MRRLRRAAFSAVQLATRDLPELLWNAPLGPQRAVAFTRLPLRGVSRIRATHGGSVNYVVLAVLAGGLNRFLAAYGRETRGLELTALVPVSCGRPTKAAELGKPPIGLSVDADLVPDLEKLERELEAAFASLLGSAGG